MEPASRVQALRSPSARRSALRSRSDCWMGASRPSHSSRRWPRRWSMPVRLLRTRRCSPRSGAGWQERPLVGVWRPLILPYHRSGRPTESGIIVHPRRRAVWDPSDDPLYPSRPRRDCVGLHAGVAFAISRPTPRPMMATPATQRTKLPGSILLAAALSRAMSAAQATLSACPAAAAAASPCAVPSPTGPLSVHKLRRGLRLT